MNTKSADGLTCIKRSTRSSLTRQTNILRMRSSLDTILPQIHNYIRCWFVENTAPFTYNRQEININNGEICIDTMSVAVYSIIGNEVSSFVPCWGCEDVYRAARRAWILEVQHMTLVAIIPLKYAQNLIELPGSESSKSLENFDFWNSFVYHTIEFLKKDQVISGMQV